MILRALVQFYENRLATGEMAPPGFEEREIPFLIELSPEGKFARLSDTFVDDKRKRARAFTVPQAIKRSSGVASNLLWDHCGYVFGVDGKGTDEDRLAEQAAAFRSRVAELAAVCKDEGLAAVARFLEDARKKLPAKLEKDPLWAEVVESGRNLTFRIEDERRVVCERPAVRKAIAQLSAAPDPEAPVGVCAVTGEQGELAVLHPAIQGVRGAQSSGANIVSFNQSAFTSFGKEQGLNAPVSSRAAFAYTTALNTLLGRDSSRKLHLADTTIVFWADESHEFEDQLAGLLAEPRADSREGAEEKAAKSVREFFEAFRSGKRPLKDDATGFHVLGLAPNMSRISIRFYHRGTVGSTATNVHRYFDELEIVRGTFDREYLSLDHLLRATAVRGERDRIHPGLEASLLQAILAGSPYPRYLLAAVCGRSAADHDQQSRRFFDHARAALLKAFLNRERRLRQSDFIEVQTTMDENNLTPAYRLGRLFAVLEHVQLNAIGRNINTTIRDRYFATAGNNPAYVFPNLINLAQHHLSKLKPGSRTFYDKKIQAILAPVSEYPHRLAKLEDRGLFQLGYYHEKHALYQPGGSHADDEQTEDQEDDA